jgi:hypothetical protein
MSYKETQEYLLRAKELRDRNMEYRMTLYGSNFYGLKHLMPLIETIAYISMEAAWPKPKK